MRNERIGNEGVNPSSFNMHDHKVAASKQKLDVTAAVFAGAKEELSMKGHEVIGVANAEVTTLANKAFMYLPRKG